jgi:hypothetical protein
VKNKVFFRDGFGDMQKKTNLLSNTEISKYMS